MNNKGFTLIEVIAVVAIIAILGIVATPSVLNTLDIGKKTSDQILYSNIKVALQTIYEEIYYSNHTFYEYNENGESGNDVVIESNKIETNIQTLVSNGLLTGINNKNSTSSNKNYKILLDSNNNDLGKCRVIITKEIVGNSKVSYTVTANEDNNEIYCPKTADFEGV